MVLPNLLFIFSVMWVADGRLFSDITQSISGENGSSRAVSALYIMGDSSVDCGENSLFYPILHPKLSLLPCSGSESILPNLLAEKMGLPHPRPFYGENGSNGGLQVGINYGSAEATIMNPGGQSHQSLDQQLRQALETLQLLQLQFKEEEARRLIESSIFYVSFGKNDYINLFLGNSSGILRKYTGREFAQLLVDRMSQAMKILHDANVRKIICMGMLPLGCAPRVIWEWHNSTLLYDGSGCIGDVNELILQYNAMLEEHTLELNSKLPSAHIIFCDVYQGMMEIINNPGYYGFNDSKAACCGLGLLGASIGCLSVEMACNQSSGYVWWDLYNPTQALNSFLANSAWSGQIFPSVCRPIMIQDLVHIAV